MQKLTHKLRITRDVEACTDTLLVSLDDAALCDDPPAFVRFVPSSQTKALLLVSGVSSSSLITVERGGASFQLLDVHQARAIRDLAPVPISN